MQSLIYGLWEEENKTSESVKSRSKFVIKGVINVRFSFIV